ncbi:phospholipase D family protein [Roseovarius sp. SCSIO 43702]|uniref:phospholipase D family protein n=1 Tax=Roseovarius sp. SCSIO 43702 TaxID=2823043 RepID=UPI001C736E42|nr:phospholipase D family protein [Roseovarius sp. SCSIO 43702]QYX56639.1 phospholipase D family protein [Roseovarius sp. SCSIO 43702]
MRLPFSLPDVSDRPTSLRPPPRTDTALGAAMRREGEGHDAAHSGVRVLQSGRDALAARLALIEAAEVAVDAQYYIWHDDVSGMLMFDALERAARRGVRVRLLLDDNGIDGLDPFLAALNECENFEVRIFNPSPIRRLKILGFALNFFRMNHRMHNKALIVDGAATIIGGRNVGDEYFQVHQDIFYIDTDAIATGPVVTETAKIFDEYWNSAPVIELERVVGDVADRPAYEAHLNEIRARDEACELRAEADSFAHEITHGDLAFEWTTVSVIADDPRKGLGNAKRDQLLIHRMGEMLTRSTHSLDVASAYFVPGKTGARYLTELARKDCKVRVLTNALDTTDVFLVHAGYSRYRRTLLKAGVELYELKLRAAAERTPDQQVLPLGLSGGSLHAKTFVMDEREVFIGSFNFDPRSARLNCEMGFLIDSPEIAATVTQSFESLLPRITYQPRLTPENNMVWIEEREDGKDIIYQREPGANLFQQIAFAIIQRLPIEWLL